MRANQESETITEAYFQELKEKFAPILDRTTLLIETSPLFDEYPAKQFFDPHESGYNNERLVLYTQPNKLKKHLKVIVFEGEGIFPRDEALLTGFDGNLTFKVFADPKYKLAVYHSYPVGPNFINVVGFNVETDEELDEVIGLILANKDHGEAVSRSGEFFWNADTYRADLPFGFTPPETTFTIKPSRHRPMRPAA